MELALVTVEAAFSSVCVSKLWPPPIPPPDAVAGNTAVTTPELAEFVTIVAPATVKKFAVTPDKM